MTRINIISPSELTDQHLIAEYREIFMVAGSLKRTLISKSGFVESKVPKNFTLNSGHVKYLYKRYNLIIKEMKSRGFKPDQNRVFPKDIFIMNNLFNDWEPNQSDIKIIRKRINEKIAMKPSWYRKTKNK